MREALTIVQIVFSLVLIFLILVQARGTGFGRSSGGSSSSFSRRGLEKLIFRSTFFVVFVFLAISIALLLI